MKNVILTRDESDLIIKFVLNAMSNHEEMCECCNLSDEPYFEDCSECNLVDSWDVLQSTYDKLKES